MAVSMTKEKFASLLMKAAVKLIKEQKERIEGLEREVDMRDDIIENMSSAAYDTNVVLSNISEELTQTQELIQANELVSDAYVAVLRMKLREGASRESIIENISEYLGV